jgi:hypothetical protein
VDLAYRHVIPATHGSPTGSDTEEKEKNRLNNSSQ